MAFKNATVLTGGIATGKSTVANIFRGYGFEIIDADKIAHEMLDLHHKEIAELFGSEYVEEGKVIRKKLGALIFADEKEKERLGAVLHPLIFDEIEKQSIELDKKEEPYLIDIPLFFETNRYPIEKSIVVYIPQKMQLERLMKRDNSTQQEAQNRIDAQLDIEEKKHKATYLIENKKDLESLKKICDKVKIKIIGEFKGK